MRRQSSTTCLGWTEAFPPLPLSQKNRNTTPEQGANINDTQTEVAHIRRVNSDNAADFVFVIRFAVTTTRAHISQFEWNMNVTTTHQKRQTPMFEKNKIILPNTIRHTQLPYLPLLTERHTPRAGAREPAQIDHLDAYSQTIWIPLILRGAWYIGMFTGASQNRVTPYLQRVSECNAPAPPSARSIVQLKDNTPNNWSMAIEVWL